MKKKAFLLAIAIAIALLATITMLGRDLAVENGAREDFRLNFRYARAF